jgi:myo-inositol 2-dehydrogenase/D-chiro-inositol 1-dehydrogenase
MSNTRANRSDAPSTWTDDLAVAVLGAGNMGSVHLQSAAAVDCATVVAAADVVPSNRHRAQSLGADRVYEDFRPLLHSEDVDVAIVALPPSLHRDAAETAMRADCDVFVEKPFARNVAEAEAIREVAAETGATVGVDHTIRYQPEMEAVKDAYDEGRLGHVPFATITRVNNGPFASPPNEDEVAAWQLDPETTGGGALLDLGVHLFDVLEWVLGECEVVHAELDSTLNLPYEDAATVTLRSVDDGTTATLQCGFFQWEDPPDVNTSFRLDGVAESIDSADHEPSQFLVHAATSAAANALRALVGGDPKTFAPTYYYRAHYRAVEDFLQAVANDAPAPVGVDEGVRSIELAEAAYDAAGAEYRDTVAEVVEGAR